VRSAPIAVLVILAGCAPQGDGAFRPAGSALENRRHVWAWVQPMAKARGIAPLFVYALVGLESILDPRARNGDARGLLQLKLQAREGRLDDPPFAGRLE
jgi:soluble lytic murein transglycosylase-like protein